MIHNLSYRAFVYGTENKDKVKKAIHTIFPLSKPQETLNEGYYKNSVLILHDKIQKKNDIKNFIKVLQGMKSSDKKKILRQLDNKMDNKGNLFLRFDKQRAYVGELKIVEHGDSIHVKIKIAAYPAKKEPALKLAGKLWG